MTMTCLLIPRYLPIDATGNWIYQSFDVATVYVLVKLVYSMQRNYKCAILTVCDSSLVCR